LQKIKDFRSFAITLLNYVYNSLINNISEIVEIPAGILQIIIILCIMEQPKKVKVLNIVKALECLDNATDTLQWLSGDIISSKCLEQSRNSFKWLTKAVSMLYIWKKSIEIRKWLKKAKKYLTKLSMVDYDEYKDDVKMCLSSEPNSYYGALIYTTIALWQTEKREKNCEWNTDYRIITYKKLYKKATDSMELFYRLLCHHCDNTTETIILEVLKEKKLESTEQLIPQLATVCKNNDNKSPLVYYNAKGSFFEPTKEYIRFEDWDAFFKGDGFMPEQESL